MGMARLDHRLLYTNPPLITRNIPSDTLRNTVEERYSNRSEAIVVTVKAAHRNGSPR